ncbi:MAG TPA: hypothetical protein VMV87_18710 [Burkholderiales bacterium]|nr:hypothetical protein [Burkholderiales bacterium]
MSGPVDVLAIGISAALRNCADYLRDEQGLTEAAKQIEAVDAAIAELIEAAKRVIASDDAHESLHAPDGDDIARMVEYADAYNGLREALAAIGHTP